MGYRRTNRRLYGGGATVAMLRRQSTLVVGVYVGPQEHLARLEAIFGTADTLPVAQVREVPQALGRVLQRAAATRQPGLRRAHPLRAGT